MTREEFNKLSQQDKLNMVGKKWFSLHRNNKEYGWVIEKFYHTDDEGKKHLTSERSYINVELPYQKYFKDLNVFLGRKDCGDYHMCYKTVHGVVFTLGDVPEDFLEEAYFFAFPKSIICENVAEYNLDTLVPLEKQYTDCRSIEDICQTSQKTAHCEPISEIKRQISRFDNPQTLTKVNAIIIGLAALYTLINIFFL